RTGPGLVQPGRVELLQLHDPRAHRRRGRRRGGGVLSSRPRVSSSRAEASRLLGVVCGLPPPLVPGNTVVLLASQTRPLPAVTLTDVLATSDVPGGVVNVLTGLKAELVPVLAGHVE